MSGSDPSSANARAIRAALVLVQLLVAMLLGSFGSSSVMHRPDRAAQVTAPVGAPGRACIGLPTASCDRAGAPERTREDREVPLACVVAPAPVTVRGPGHALVRAEAPASVGMARGGSPLARGPPAAG